MQLLSAYKRIFAALFSFFADRLKVALREKGIRHDLIDAVFALGSEDDLVRLVARVEALQEFLKTEDGTNLLAGYKRAANILKVEEKRDGKTYAGTVDPAGLTEPAEKALFAALKNAQSAIAPALENEDFAGAMRHLAALRVPVDAFFEKVKVNAEDARNPGEPVASSRRPAGGDTRNRGLLQNRRYFGMTKWVYAFGDGKAEGQAGMKNLLGGKGANLAEMSNLGLPVPPGFSITTEVCTYYYANKQSYPPELKDQVDRALREIGYLAHGNFGDPEKPLLVSVRSGARVSMPGMMDTVLNLGLNAATAEGLAKLTGDPALRL